MAFVIFGGGWGAQLTGVRSSLVEHVNITVLLYNINTINSLS